MNCYISDDKIVFLLFVRMLLNIVCIRFVFPFFVLLLMAAKMSTFLFSVLF